MTACVCDNHNAANLPTDIMTLDAGPMNDDAVSHQRPIAEIHTGRKLIRRALLAAGVLVALFAGAVWYRHAAESAAEKQASEFVAINGFTGLDYRDNVLSRLLAFIPRGANQKRLGGQHVIAASFPRDRMTNNMAQELIKFRHLEFITLYPPDPDGSGIDFSATSVTTLQSLRAVELPLSEKSISLIEERFPNIVIRVVERPGSSATPDAESDATN